MKLLLYIGQTQIYNGSTISIWFADSNSVFISVSSCYTSSHPCMLLLGNWLNNVSINPGEFKSDHLGSDCKCNPPAITSLSAAKVM